MRRIGRRFAQDLSTICATLLRIALTTIPRAALPVLERRLAAGRVVVVNGPRQCGKTSLLRVVAGSVGGRVASLDDPSTLRGARSDPTSFVANRPKPMFIDEVQRGGDPLVLAIKYAVDRDDTRGQFVLAGSTRFLAEPRLSESLAGRARFLDLWPFSQSEIERHSGDFIDRAFDASQPWAIEGEPRAKTLARIVTGGFPEAVAIDDRRDRMAFFGDYVRTTAGRDLVELSTLGAKIDFANVVRLLAARTAQELNVSSLANDLQLGRDTARRYLPLLDAIFLHVTVPAWSTNLSAKTTRRPKSFLTDTGLVAALLNLDDRALVPGSAMLGPLVETFVVTELMKLATWSAEPVRLYHWRDRDGAEVDAVLEHADGRIVAIEVKASATVDAAAGRHLAMMRDRLGDRFVQGIVLYLGADAVQLGHRLAAVPLCAMWS